MNQEHPREVQTRTRPHGRVARKNVAVIGLYNGHCTMGCQKSSTFG